LAGNDARFTFHRMDLNHDLDAMMALIEKEKPAYVVNFAAQSMVGESWKHPELGSRPMPSRRSAARPPAADRFS
jgi:GDP-D-mannose dehydratase